ncbi:TPA: hypothetical protein HNC95_27130, partial [Escherichia coli]|nr:hypothetical protein [Escherichia coli]
PKTSIICSPMTSLKTSIKTITYLSDIGCLEIQGASLPLEKRTSSTEIRGIVEPYVIFCNFLLFYVKTKSKSFSLSLAFVYLLSD